MAFGILIIGDEILSGRREDKHLRKLIEILGARGLMLDWAEYVGDQPARITETLKRTFADSDIVFCTGGIGATPDDHTRQCAAAALGVPLALHPQAREQIARHIAQSAAGDPRQADFSTPQNQHRFRMGEFPAGARIIPNAYNGIPGFSVADHHFMPGFPEMAWPMMAWILDTHYARQFHRAPREERSFLVFGLPESRLASLMERIEAEFKGVKIFSLPSEGDAAQGARSYIDLGVKGPPEAVARAYRVLREGAAALGGEILDADAAAIARQSLRRMP